MRWTRAVLYLVAAPYAVPVGFGFVGLTIVLGMAHRPAFDRHRRLTAQWRPWVTKHWRWSTTIGFGKVFQPHHRANARIVAHEECHCWQVEDLMFLSCLIAQLVMQATGNLELALVVYLTGGVWQGPGFITAALRFGLSDAYRGAEHERSAYAQTDEGPDGMSWLEEWEMG